MYDPMMSYHFPFTLKKKENDWQKKKKFSSVKKTNVYVVYACV